MQLIFMRGPLGQVKSVSIDLHHIIAAVAVAVLLLLGMVLGGSWAAVHYGQQWPIVGGWIERAAVVHVANQDQSLRQHLQAVGVRLGELQAQMVRLDALGERLAKASGVGTADLNFKEIPGRGGPMLPKGARELSLTELQQSVDGLQKQIDRRGDSLAVLDTEWQRVMSSRTRIPSEAPVSNAGFSSSSFGWRIDPFTGKSAMHEGVDFIAPVGTPILAAAGGLVVTASFHPQFGNMIEVDHGNGIITRYAHASRLLAKKGDVVKRGQKIAEIGTTGRSTGAHLHFEVRVADVPQNPADFLAKNGMPRPGPATIAALNGVYDRSPDQ